MFPNTENRSTETEIMDDFSMEGELLRKTLDKIAAINHWLGGNRITIDGLKELLKNQSKNQPLTIVDLGCGNGDMLREVAKFGRKNGWKFQLIGIDANEFTVNYAKEKSQNFPEIQYLYQNIFSEEFRNLNYDIALCTLFLHHFNHQEILSLLSQISNKTKIGIVINDLQRSKIAYFLFQLLTIFILNKMVRADGLTSILRGFKKSELFQIAKKLNFKNSKIQWRWAFRYQWVINF